MGAMTKEGAAGTRHGPWWDWGGGAERRPFTVGIEEEVMMLDGNSCALAYRIESVLPRLPRNLASQTSSETHGSAVELRTVAHDSVSEATGELAKLRNELESTLADLSLRAAGAGTHPFAVWQESVVTAGERADFVHGSMRELARREPTFALHVHVAMPEAERAIRVANRMRVHGPTLLALSANSPFWQGRDTGLASARTPLFQAFPRVGVPRAFASYEEYVRTVELLIRSEAIPDPTFLWWDVRPQPRLGTVEVRVMDTQTGIEETAGLTALIQCLVRLEAEEEFTPESVLGLQEVIDENRFLAARDGARASLIDPLRASRVDLADHIDKLIERCRPHAHDLDCEPELEVARGLARVNGAVKQIERARELERLPELVAWLAECFQPARNGVRPSAVSSR